MTEEEIEETKQNILALTRSIMNNCYILEGKSPRKCKSVKEYIDFDRPNLKRIARTHIGGATVSTVFLMHDHNWHLDGLPILFETMVFGGDMDGYQERYSSYDEAIEGHKRICEMAEGREIFCLTALADNKQP